MQRKYSVFISNVGSCLDRYCTAYGPSFTITELFDRAASIPELSAVDIVMTQDFRANKDEVRESVKRTGLKIASVAVDTFANPIYQRGSLASVDEKIRAQAVADAKDAIDFAKELGCNIVTLWPGQDGYDYIFQADYIKERTYFEECLKEIADYDPDVTITLEYKLKEPRTHSYISTCGATLLMIEHIGRANVGIALDYGHAALGYESPAEAVAMCKMYGDRLKHIHINDNYRLWDDDMIVGSVHTLEYLEFIYWLRRTGYEGYITLDQFPYREDGREAVAESAKWLDALEEVLDRADMDEIAATIDKCDAIAASRLMRKLLLGR